MHRERELRETLLNEPLDALAQEAARLHDGDQPARHHGTQQQRTQEDRDRLAIDQ